MVKTKKHKFWFVCQNISTKWQVKKVSWGSIAIFRPGRTYVISLTPIHYR